MVKFLFAADNIANVSPALFFCGYYPRIFIHLIFISWLPIADNV